MRRVAVRVGIAACSNGLEESARPELERLLQALRAMGMDPVCSPHLFARRSAFSADGEARARALMDFYRDDGIREIFDVSGGDLANEILPWLNYEVIARSDKCLWGYSDLTCVLNAILARTGRTSMLYQARNLVRRDGAGQIARFQDMMAGGDGLTRFSFRFLRGSSMEGVAAGGNVRCLLKLAGTPFWPELRGKILLLEGLGTTVPQAAAYVAQLRQTGALDAAAGILVGTFTRMEERGDRPSFEELLLASVDPGKPVAKTDQVGHGADSRAVRIGARLCLRA